MPNNFLKKVGIIFIEDAYTKSGNVKLNFDQFACSSLLVQMNFAQQIFDFNIIEVDFYKQYILPNKESLKKDHKHIFNWFDDLLVKQSKNNSSDSILELNPNIDYWIGITSENIYENWFFDTKSNYETKCKKTIGIITTDTWEKSFSPPSVFEYISISVFKICMALLSYDYNGTIYTHDKWITKGCLSDFTNLKPHRRTIVSNPNLCEECKYKLDNLDKTIQNSNKKIFLKQDIENILSKKWMGDPTIRDTPLFNLKKNFKYDVDRNSGFYKGKKEKFIDAIIENLPTWTIGSLMTSIITGAVTGIVAGMVILLGLK